MSQRHLIDLREIEDVLIRYASAIDQRDWDLFRSCFTDDVVADYEGIGRWKGVGTLTDFMRDAHDGLGSMLHRLTNMAITVIDDGARARTYVDALILATDGQLAGNPIGFYDDDIVRTDDGWRIRERTFTAVRLGAAGGGR